MSHTHRRADAGNRRGRFRVITGSVLLATVLALSTTAPTGAATAEETISPDRGPIGTTVTIRGTVEAPCATDGSVTAEIGAEYGSRPDGSGATTATWIGTGEAVAGTYTITATIPDRIGDSPGTATGPGDHRIHVYCVNPAVSVHPFLVGTTIFTVADDGTPATPGVTLDASTVTAGGPVSFSADGFAPDSQVAVELHSEPVALGTVRADAAGHVAGTVTIPSDTPAGDHDLVLIGTDPNGDPLELRTAITIVATSIGDRPGGDDHGTSTGGAPVPATPVDARPTYTG